MSLLKITIKIVYNYYSSFKGSKYKMVAKFGQKNVHVTKSTDVPFLAVVKTCQNKAFLTLWLFITNYDIVS